MPIAYINLYTAGRYHRIGKPGTFNAHPGDMYATRQAAAADVYPADLFLGTYPVMIPYEQFKAMGLVNPDTSVPVPLEESKEIYAAFGAAGLREFISDFQEGAL